MPKLTVCLTNISIKGINKELPLPTRTHQDRGKGYIAASINKDCEIKMAIIDKDVNAPPNIEIVYDLKQDKKRFFVDKESGVIVIPKGYKFS